MMDEIFHFYTNSFAQMSLLILFALVLQFALRKRSNIKLLAGRTLGLKRSRLLTICILVCCVVVLGICAALHFTKSDQTNSGAGRDSAVSNILQTVGNEQIGASLPEIVFADESKVAWYDYHGLFIYDIENKRLTDYVAFADTELSSAVQGDDATFVYALADGQTYYLTDGHSILYIYENGALNRLEYSSDKIVKSKLWVLVSTRSVLCSFEYDAETDGADGTYKYINLIVDKNGKSSTYSIFR